MRAKTQKKATLFLLLFLVLGMLASIVLLPKTLAFNELANDSTATPYVCASQTEDQNQQSVGLLNVSKFNQNDQNTKEKSNYGWIYGVVFGGLIVLGAGALLAIVWLISQMKWLKKNPNKKNVKLHSTVLPILLGAFIYATELSILTILCCVAGVLLIANGVAFGSVKRRKKHNEAYEARQNSQPEKEVEEIAVTEDSVDLGFKPKIKEDDNFIVIKYSRSFISKIIQASEQTKDFYSELKNEILSYKKVKSRISWKHESFRVGRALAVRMSVKGKTLCLNLALNPEDYINAKFKVEDVSDVNKNADVPALFRVSGTRKLAYAKELIASVMAKFGLEKQIIERTDYAYQHPYEEDKPLIKKGLIKVLTDKDAKKGTRFATSKEEVATTMDNTATVRYDRSFASKIIRAKKETKVYYSELKNEILSYAKVKSRISWKHESFRVGRALAVRMSVKGKTLCLNLALNPEEYINAKYKIENVSSVNKNADVPTLIRISGVRKLGFAKELIASVMAKFGLEKQQTEVVNYVKQNALQSEKTLIQKGLIKVLSREKAKRISEIFPKN